MSRRDFFGPGRKDGLTEAPLGVDLRFLGADSEPLVQWEKVNEISAMVLTANFNTNELLLFFYNNVSWFNIEVIYEILSIFMLHYSKCFSYSSFMLFFLIPGRSPPRRPPPGPLRGPQHQAQGAGEEAKGGGGEQGQPEQHISR